MIVFLLILGASLGSFCKALADRIIYKQKIFSPRSFCFNCKKKLGILELVPIFSYLFLKAKCKYCKNKIPFEIFLSEIIGIFLICIAYFYNVNLYDFIVFSFFIFNLFLLSLIDIKLKAVPEILLWSAFFLAGFYTFKIEEIFYIFVFESLKEGFLFYAISFSGILFLFKSFILFLTNLKRENKILDNLGDADIIIIACIGGILGFKDGFITLFIACVLTLPFFMIKVRKEKELAMIPFLSISFILVWIFKVNYETLL
ncbi:prepilin peptidase [Campylobacter sp. 2018MI35]|uniref:prepilin peptidase n=1 Tax=Campylobacter sp. 2018MI34 TaxID=2800582 RepID=UPI00190541B9|nr:A24 family peptidase [Campylobacter sp. 2018MI34]MBK1991276.1 prepilin peptidase [Campylobacter sp. 2018MI34]